MTDESLDPPLPRPEPSVLDVVKSRLSFGRRPRVEIPSLEGPETTLVPPPVAREVVSPRPLAITEGLAAIPWRSLGALVLALAAQSLLEPPGRGATAGILLYAPALALLVWAALRGEWQLASLSQESTGQDPLTYRRLAFILSVPVAAVAFLALGGNLFNDLNLTLWLGALGLLIWSLWLRDPGHPSSWRRFTAWISRPHWEIRFNAWTLLVLAASGLVIFFRLYNLQSTPAEPFSDHAEKLLDVLDVSRGQTHIFSPRNTGREALQMYWTLLISWIFGSGFSFLSLKLGTALIGLLTLPYMYLLGREVGGRRLGLLVLVLTGIAYWPNVISRVGLRFPLYPLFVAPLMFHLLRGMRTRSRNDFILAGLFLGLGLHGYSPFRIVPLLVVTAFALYLLHAESRGARRSSVLWLVIIALVSLFVFLPLLRYATENPNSFNERAWSRLAEVEQPLPAPWYQVLVSNTWNALKLFNWENGGIWVHSLPNRPAMDVVTAALFLLGVVLLAARYGEQRHWQDLFLLLSIPILLLPSILSLAFPDENPSLNRTAGALVPAFLIAALALDGLITAVSARGKRNVLACLLAVLLLWRAASQNYDLVFRQYDENFRLNAWNSSEMGAIIKQFGDAYGTTTTAWVIPFPYWVDTRLVGVWAGVPDRDFALWTDELPVTLPLAGPKLFIAKAHTELPDLNDGNAVAALREMYPQGSLSLHRSTVPGREHDFWVYFVPALTGP